MEGAQVDQRVLREFVQERFHKLHLHFERLGVDLSMFTFNWILTIFLDAVPPPTAVRIWDAVLYEGDKVRARIRTHARSTRTRILRLLTHAPTAPHRHLRAHTDAHTVREPHSLKANLDLPSNAPMFKC
jgi:hypothetical protein